MGSVLCVNHQRSGNVLSHSREHYRCGYRALKNSAEFASVRSCYHALSWCVVRMFVCYLLTDVCLHKHASALFAITDHRDNSHRRG